jgi:predicted RecA/RadA family phage recombinase
VTNEIFARGEQLTVASPSGITIHSGDALLFGSKPCVAVTGNPPPGSRTTSGNITIKFVGVDVFSVVGQSSLSPAVNAAVAVGDKIYYDGGTKDATTGITYGGTLDVNSSTGVLFGEAMATVSSGATSSIPVRLG